MACNIQYNDRGQVEMVLTDYGTPSKLYAEAKAKLGEKEALNIFYVSQSDEFRNTQGRGLLDNKTGNTQNFFSEVVQGSDKYRASQEWVSLLPFTEEESNFKEVYDTFKGNFDNHIATSIPTFRETQIKVGSAIVNMYDNALVYDIGGSEGGFVKAITKESNGDIESINLDVNESMGQFHNATPVEGSTFVNEAFYEGYTDEDTGVTYKEHKPAKKADVVHESMVFQFITPEREQFIKEIKDNYLKKDGIVLLEEKLVPNTQEEWLANEAKKDAYKRQFYSQEAITAKSEEILTGMLRNQTKEEDLKAYLRKEFKYVKEYWNAGNFKGYIASNDYSKVEQFLVELDGGITSEFSSSNLDPQLIADKYTKLLTKTKEENPDEFWSVGLPTPEVIKSAAQDGRIVDVKGGMGLVTEDGDMMGLFKYDSSQTGTAAAVQEARIKLGGIKLDNYDGYLTGIYKKNGFRVASRIPFSESLAPEGWDKSKHGTPDVVFMVYDPNSMLNIQEKTFSDYESAQSYRNSFVEQAKTNQNTPFRSEPSLESVLQFITSQNESKQPMNDEQTQSFKNALISTPEFSYNNLKKAFYDENGIFLVSPQKLVASGLYNEYEAEQLQKNIDLQKEVKSSIEALKNTDDLILLEQDFDSVEIENEFNSFGKLNNLNPYVVKKEIQNALAATTQNEFDEAIGDLPFPNFQKTVNKEELFKEMQAYKKAEMLIEVDGVIKASNNSNTETVIPQVAQDLSGTKVLSDIKDFMSQNLNILKAMKEQSATLLRGIESRLIEQGYDVIGLASKAPSIQMLEYFNSVVNLSEDASQESLNEYVRVYDDYFAKDLSPQKGFIKTSQDDRNFVKLNSELKEEEVYNQQGLIKQKEGVYIRVNPKSSEELYPILLTYPEKIPSGITTEEQLRKFVQSQSNNDEVTNPETAEVINLFKMYYGIPLEQIVAKEDVTEFNQKQAQFTGNINYLTTDFVGDFYRKGLKEQAKESKLWKDFYSNFKVTEKGLELVNDDPITLDSIKPYVSEDLKNYSLISKSMPNLNSEEVEFVDSKNSRRDLISNYPSTLEKFDGNISILDNDNLVTKNSNKEFIKLNNDLFENVASIGNLTLYTKLDISTGNTLVFNVQAPISKYFLEDYLYLDSQPEFFVKAKNYLSKEEKDSLSNDEFECL